jgi:uncharacterized membrane protein YbhN (UPF0104 family)
MPRPRKAVTVAEAGNTAADPLTVSPRPSRLREIVGLLVLILVLAAVAFTVAQNWHDFVQSLQRVGLVGIALSLLCGVIGVVATYLQWRAVLRGLYVPMSVGEGARVFFVSQLGKYLPGSVWPVVMQMEAGRRLGANRKKMLAANVITVVISITTGVLLAGLLLPFSVPSALRRFWWALAALPLLLVLVHPRSLPFLLDIVLRRMRRAPLGVEMSSSATLRAAFWSLVSWAGLGAHLAVLCAALGQPSVGLVALCVGGIALAISAGVIAIPVPAGAGIRELVLGYALVAVLTSGQVVAVVVASRVILILGDVLLALLAAVGRRHRAGVGG